MKPLEIYDISDYCCHELLFEIRSDNIMQNRQEALYRTSAAYDLCFSLREYNARVVRK